MRVELPSGNWVEVREELKGRDRTATRSALKFLIKDKKEQEMGADVMDRMHDALLASIITSWSYPEPIPAEQGGADAVADLDIDDYSELHKQTQHLEKKVNFKNPN